jgi:hypothetical protein
MTITEFATQRRLKTRREDCGDFIDVIITGNQGQIYEVSLDGSKFGVMFMPPKTATEPWGRWCPKRWGNFRRAGIAAGMTILQNGDSEGCLQFDPTDKAQSTLAIRIAGVRPKRRVSPETAAAGAARLALSRQKGQKPQQEAL